MTPMKPGPTSPGNPAPLLAFGAHPDDIEFGCGGVVAVETQAGRPAHLVVCSRGEAATHGTPEQRTREAEAAAACLNATLEWLELDGDAHLELRVAHTLKLAAIIRRRQPAWVVAPSLVPNQHPDHARLGSLVRDAARLARYGGVAELRDLPPHAIAGLFYYAVTPEAEPRDISPVLVDVSAPAIITAWTAAMRAHASQTGALQYVELQITRARLHGLRSGLEYAVPLFPNDPLVLGTLGQLGVTARRY